jgi:hypothetical protein
MYCLKRVDKCVEIKDPDMLVHDIEWLLQRDQTCFSVEETPREYLSVIYTSRGCGVIYIRHDPTYLALDASTEASNSRKRVTIMVDNEPTPFPANMKLTKQQAMEIIREFCISGKLSDSVYWIKEGPA